MKKHPVRWQFLGPLLTSVLGPWTRLPFVPDPARTRIQPSRLILRQACQGKPQPWLIARPRFLGQRQANKPTDSHHLSKYALEQALIAILPVPASFTAFLIRLDTYFACMTTAYRIRSIQGQLTKIVMCSTIHGGDIDFQAEHILAAES